MEPQQVYLSLEAERMITVFHHVLFALSIASNALATYCLIRQAPEMQSEIKFYLYYMQVLCLLSDVLFDVAVEPFPLLPILGGYCKGPICEWVSIRFSLIFTMLLLCNVGFCMLASLLCRHQAIVAGRFRFGRIANRIFPIAIFVFVSIPGMYGSAIHFDDSKTGELIVMHNITWIAARGPHVVYARSTSIALILPLILYAVMVSAAVSGCTLVAHIMWHVRRGTQRSTTSSKRLTRALLVLTIQIGLPIWLLQLPAVLFVRCLMDGNSLKESATAAFSLSTRTLSSTACY